MPLDAPILPPLMPGQMIRDWIIQSACLTGATSVQRFWKRLMNSAFSTGWIFTSHLEQIAHFLTNSSLDEIIANHTVIPVFRLFTTTDLYDAMEAKVRGGSTNRVYVGTLFRGNSVRPRICSECAREDHIKNLPAFVRRDHCLPGVYVCAKHAVLLSSGCARCSMNAHLDGVTVREDGTCACGRLLVPVLPGISSPTDLCTLSRVSKIISVFSTSEAFANQGLNGRLSRCYKLAIVKHGIHSSTELSRMMEEKIGVQLLTSFGIQGTPNWARMVMLSRRFSVPNRIFLNALLVDILFNNAQEFIKEFRKAEPIASKERIDQSYSTIRSVLQSNCKITYSELEENHPREVGLIKLVNNSWIIRNLSGYQPKNTIQSAVERRSLDDALVEHMKGVLNTLESHQGYPIKIGRHLLTKGYSQSSLVRRRIPSLPKTMKFIKKYEDTAESFKCKVVQFLMRNYPGNEIERLRVVRRTTAISKMTARQLEVALPTKGREPLEVKLKVKSGLAQRLKARRRKT
jgi:hypothetical protein